MLSSKEISQYLLSISKKYNIDLTEIGGYNWVFGIPYRFPKYQFYDLVNELENFCKNQDMEYNLEEAIDGVPIMIEIKGLRNVEDFYEGGRSLYERPDFWNNKPVALSQRISVDKKLNKDIDDVENDKFDNLSEEEKDLITLHRLKKKYGENFEKMI